MNYTEGSVKGLQAGFVNYTGKLTGLQFGLLNIAKTAENGVQIGIINILPQNDWFDDLPKGFAPGMPFINWRF